MWRRIAGGFLDRPVAVKLTMLVTVSLLALVTCLVVSGVTAAQANRTAGNLQRLNLAGTYVLRLDRLASELKASGLEALVREHPAGETAKLNNEVTQTRDLLTRLAAISLPAAQKATVTKLTAVYGDYIDVITRYVSSAGSDQSAARLGWAQIGVDNYLVSTVLAHATEEFARVVAAGESRAAAQRTGGNHVMWATVGVAALVVIALAWIVVLSITRPLVRVRTALQGLAQGDLTASAAVTSRDEVGQMARDLDTALADLRGVVGAVTVTAGSVATAADRMSSNSAAMSGAIADAARQSELVSENAGTVARNVQTVAAGGVEMGAAITEIAHSAAEAARVAGQAVTIAEQTTQQVGKLGDSSAEIASVISVITAIAAQTNLLALNATIEAARAGESGKGFAVVAGEVKELAQETARATEDIAQRVQAIQSDTAGAVEAIGEITDVINQINAFQTTIASAVEEQTATTSEMNRGVAAAAEGVGGIAATIDGLAEASRVTNEGVTQSRDAVIELNTMAGKLQTLVSQFRV